MAVVDGVEGAAEDPDACRALGAQPLPDPVEEVEHPLVLPRVRSDHKCRPVGW
jgi:hypothetical protein